MEGAQLADGLQEFLDLLVGKVGGEAADKELVGGLGDLVAEGGAVKAAHGNIVIRTRKGLVGQKRERKRKENHIGYDIERQQCMI